MSDYNLVVNEVPTYNLTVADGTTTQTLSVTEGVKLNLNLNATVGPTGPVGPNSVTSATTSDGTANLVVNSESFNLAPTGTNAVGRLRWNDTDGTLDLGLKGGNVTLQIGQEQVVRIVNKSEEALNEADFRAVRVRSVAEGGASGQRLAVVLAQADSDSQSATTIGVVTETIAVNQEGFITTSGNVSGVDTTGAKSFGGLESWQEGQVLYLSPYNAGYLTNVKPTAPEHTIIIGWVVYRHSQHGKIFVKVDNGYELEELHNVSVTGLAVGDILRCTSTTTNGGQWANAVPDFVTLTGDQEIFGYKTFRDDVTIGDGIILQNEVGAWNISPTGGASFDYLTHTSYQWSIGSDGSANFNSALSTSGIFSINGDLGSSAGRLDFNTSLGSGFLYSTASSFKSWGLPNATGIIALTSGPQTFSGAQTFSGQVELTGQAATNSTSAMTRDLLNTEVLSNLSSLVDFREFSNLVSTSGGAIAAAGGMGIAVVVDTTAGATARGRTGSFRSNSGGGMTYANQYQVSVVIESLYFTALSAASIRFRLGYMGPTSAEPPANGDPLLANSRGIGVEFTRNSVNNLLQCRLFARNGTNAIAGTFIASSWVSLTGYAYTDFNRNIFFYLTHSGGPSPVVSLYLSHCSTNEPTPRLPSTPILTLSGTGVPQDQASLTYNASSFTVCAANPSSGTSGGCNIRTYCSRAKI